MMASFVQRRARMRLAIICFACVAAIGRAEGQHPAPSAADTIGAEQAAAEYAARYLLSSVSRDRLAFDSLPGNGRRRSHAQALALAKILNAEVTDRQSVISCTNGPSSCRMGTFTGMIGVQLESLDDSTATISVSVQWPSGLQRVPITTYEPTLYFAKRQGRWQFDRPGRVRSS
jgi:hypothetical protein